MSLPIIITNAGLAELINANATGTQAIEIVSFGVSSTPIVPDPTMTALPGELSRVITISGTQVTPDTIHVVMQDSTANAYAMLSFGLYLADGTLFAIYGQATAILEKTDASIGMLAVDITFATAVAGAITFGNTNFINPPASTNAMGVVQLATLAQAQAGVDAADVLTPFTAIGAVVNWLLGKAVNLGSILRAGYQVWDAGNDGAGSGLDADLWHGQTPAQLLAPLATQAQLAALFSSGSNANGTWAKRPDGNGGTILEQWGSVACYITIDGPTAITFPVPFSDATTVQITGTCDNPGQTTNLNCWIQRVSNTVNGATLYVQFAESAGTLQSFSWRAIGKG